MKWACFRLYPALQIESTQAESQWIVGQAYSQHLQYLEAIKSSAKDLSLPIFEITIDHKVRMKLGRSLCFSCNKGRGVQHCLASMDSDLEAFSRYPADGSFAALAFQLAAFTKYLNEVFLSY